MCSPFYTHHKPTQNKPKDTNVLSEPWRTLSAYRESCRDAPILTFIQTLLIGMVVMILGFMLVIVLGGYIKFIIFTKGWALLPIIIPALAVWTFRN